MSRIESVKDALLSLGIQESSELFYNPDYDLLIAHETSPELTGAARGVMTESGAVAVDTGIFTGRSPRDKYIVRDELTRDTVWWADSGTGRNDNKPLSSEIWADLKALVAGQLSGKKLYVVDAWCGASPATRLGVRFVTEVAWQAHFVKTCLLRRAPRNWRNLRRTSLSSTARAAPTINGKSRGLTPRTLSRLTSAKKFS